MIQRIGLSFEVDDLLFKLDHLVGAGGIRAGRCAEREGKHFSTRRIYINIAQLFTTERRRRRVLCTFTFLHLLTHLAYLQLQIM